MLKMSASVPEVVGSIPNGEEVERIVQANPDLLANVVALAELLKEITSQQGSYVRYLPVKIREKIILRKVDDVSWFEAHGKYVQLHAGDVSHVIRHPMHSLEARLNPAQFIRVSRWAIINIDHVNFLEPWSNGEWAITMRTGHRVISTESYRKGIQQLLKAC